MDEHIEESWGIVNQLQKYLFGPDANGSYWQPVVGTAPGASNAFLHFFRTALFNRWQRMQARFLYKVNGYAISLVDSMASMIIGEGFNYVCEDESEQQRLDEMFRLNKWHHRRCDSFKRVLVDGEVFERMFGDKLRFVDPDSVFDDTYNLGVITSPNDYEDIIEYVIHNRTSIETVPADQIQHRKLAGFDELRGTSVLFAVASHLVDAEQLLKNLTRTADQLARIAWVRTHEANAASVLAYRSSIQSQPQNQRHDQFIDGRHSLENSENYRAGTVLDTSDATKIEFPGQGIQADSFISVLRAELRLVAARAGIPENVLSQDQDSMAAYTASLVADSHCVKAMEGWQRKLIDWDLDLLEMMGFDRDKLHITGPEIAIHDRKQLVEVGNFLIDKRLASKETVGKMFEIDYDEEKEQILQDAADDESMMPQTDDEEKEGSGIDKGANEDK